MAVAGHPLSKSYLSFKGLEVKERIFYDPKAKGLFFLVEATFSVYPSSIFIVEFFTWAQITNREPLKIISFYSNEKQLLKKAIAGNRDAQRTIYERFAPKMLSVCRQYIKDVHFAEDVMVNGFVKVFKSLDSFEHRGSFEGWIRKIIVRESISYLRKQQFVVFDDDIVDKKERYNGVTNALIDIEDVQLLIDALPEGYKMVFVLYAVEGYKHHEIAKMLEISEGTSKSQLFKARRMLQENLRLKGISPRLKSNSN